MAFFSVCLVLIDQIIKGRRSHFDPAAFYVWNIDGIGPTTVSDRITVTSRMQYPLKPCKYNLFLSF